MIKPRKKRIWLSAIRRLPLAMNAAAIVIGRHTGCLDVVNTSCHDLGARNEARLAKISQDETL